jgi:DNA-binding CsgD family transcriptional regulator
MVFWNKLIQDIHNNTFIPLNEEENNQKRGLTGKTLHQNGKSPRYPLGRQYPNLYLTFREAQCVIHMMRGKTMKETADALSLSPRTVEYYIKKIKEKLNCRSKQDILNKILDSNFAHQPIDQALVDSCNNPNKTSIKPQRNERQ